MSLKLFFLTTEIEPFASTSHLGKFSVDIPLALQTVEHDIRTIIPKYGYVSERKYIIREVIRLREIPFEFGKENVIQDLQKFDTYNDGYVELTKDMFQRNNTNNVFKIEK